jgi:hypothetical protein
MRVTAFPSEVLPAERASSWWENAVGFPPEAILTRPKAGQHQSRGEFEGRRLTLQIQPGRIEWRLNALVKDDDELAVPLIGPFPEVSTSLSKVVTTWLPEAPAIGRFAFGAALLQPVDSLRGGYLLIQQYLPNVQVDADGSSDFLYQINRRRSTTTPIDGLQINRLMKWSVPVVQQVVVTVGEDGVVTRTMGTEPACRLELDINTAPEFGAVLPAEHLGALLQELMNLGREIAEEGDRA